MAANRTARNVQTEIDMTTKMLNSTLDFIRRFPNDPYTAKRQLQADQMQRRLMQLTGLEAL